MRSHHTDRVFGQHQWQSLRTKLVNWRVNNFPYVIFRVINLILFYSMEGFIFEKKKNFTILNNKMRMTIELKSSF